MKTFTVINVVKKFEKQGEIVEILKVKKDGTKRIFFKPIHNGKGIGLTLWARLCEAESVAKMYLNRNQTQN